MKQCNVSFFFPNRLLQRELLADLNARHGKGGPAVMNTAAMVSNEGRKTEGDEKKTTPFSAGVEMPDIGKLTIRVSENGAEESKSACPIQRTSPEHTT